MAKTKTQKLCSLHPGDSADIAKTRILKWWRCRKLSKRGRVRWEALRFTYGQRVNMSKYYEVTGPFQTKEEIESSGFSVADERQPPANKEKL